MLSAHWTHPSQHHFSAEMEAMGVDRTSTPLSRRKRKADSQPESNERLSKRLSLLNLGRAHYVDGRVCIAGLTRPAEQGGTKLYVPVENPQPTSTVPTTEEPFPSSAAASTAPRLPAEGDSMKLDDSKHKVYIYNLEDELSSESEAEDGKLVFLPDIEKHLRKNRIPAHVLTNPDTDFVGKELVLYRIPASISVPEEKDSVRKAIIEARARMREQQDAERRATEAGPAASTALQPIDGLATYDQGPFAQPAPGPSSSVDLDEMDLD